MKVLFTGAVFDSSGYAEASRNYISSLLLQPNIELSVQSVSFESWKTDHSVFKKKISACLNRNIGTPDVHLIHLTPENFTKIPRVAKRTIGLTVWETDKIPDSWIQLCNSVDEIWVPCKWNVDVFKQSGVSVPVHCVPHCIDVNEFNNIEIESSISSQFKSIQDTFKFYSIFQWSSRKNPEGLIKSYLSEFNIEDNVSLVLKTYLTNNSIQDRNQIVDLIKKVKFDCQLEKTPPIVLLHGSLTRSEMLTIHKLSDCFVLPHRAEGWGVPHFEAMSIGKPAIATSYGGNTEFMNEYNSWLLPYQTCPVSGMGRPTYNAKMHWADPDLSILQKDMREAINNDILLKQKASFGQLTTQKFSIENIGELISRKLHGD